MRAVDSARVYLAAAVRAHPILLFAGFEERLGLPRIGLVLLVLLAPLKEVEAKDPP
jgi:hypothetical protein